MIISEVELSDGIIKSEETFYQLMRTFHPKTGQETQDIQELKLIIRRRDDCLVSYAHDENDIFILYRKTLKEKGFKSRRSAEMYLKLKR
jgi:hypothetical protein